jgi:hypothetical protein
MEVGIFTMKETANQSWKSIAKTAAFVVKQGL